LGSVGASSLDEWLRFQAQAYPRAIDMGLERLRVVLGRLQWRRPAIPVITVAGTNGKGSVVATCAAILGAAGYRVGTFTSPHLRDYRERVRIENEPIAAAPLIEAFARIEAARGDVGLTFFEYNTLAALMLLTAAELDAWVLEIGMGGRLDAVNVVDPDVAVVVSIAFDHQEFLGDTLEAIGREKAGVFRAGRPAVLGSRQLPPVLEATARALGAPQRRLGIEFDYARRERTWDYRGPDWDLPDLPPPVLRGDTQFDNAATAIAAVEALGTRVSVSAQAVAAGLGAVRLVGRFQVIEGGPREPTWILDVAHNPDAARVLASNLGQLPTQGRTFAVCGILADKDAVGIVHALAGCIAQWLFVSLDGERGLSADALAERVAAQLPTRSSAHATVAEACAVARARASPADRIVVFGSFHTVGPALDWLEAHGQLPVRG
jgi:dihydrofolate synthase/folylpolyglutamate synthase